MASVYTHVSQLLTFFGLDLRSSDLARPRGFASDGSQNTVASPQGGTKHRPGSKIISSQGFGKTGIIRYDTTSMTGVTKTEVIGFGNDTIDHSIYPYILSTSSFVLTNNHASQAATVTHYYDEATTQFRFKITRGGSTLIDQALGIGTEGSPYMLSSLETAVDLLTSFAMSTPASSSTIPAAFMELLTGSTVAANGGTLTVYYYYWSGNVPVISATSVYASLKNAMLEVGSDSYHNVSAVVLRGCLYMSPGVTSSGSVAGGSPVTTAVISKYDGQDFYRAGFANAHIDAMSTDLYAVAAAPAAGVTDSKGTRTVSNALTGVYTYQSGIVVIDKAGNRYESNITATDSGSGTAAGQVVQVQIKNLTPFVTAANAYPYRTAKINGAQSGVSAITVDAGHTMTAGSIAYFYDSNQSRFIQREVLSTGATTVTVSTASLDSNSGSINYDVGGNVTVLDNARMTNNFRVAIWRTTGAGSSLFLVDERPVGDLASDHQYEYDDTGDSDLGAEYVEPDFPHDEPPQGRYLATFNDQLIVTGNDLKPNTVFFSDIAPEYFPKSTHEFNLERKVTGVHQTGDVLACGTKNSISVVSGDLLNFAFRVTKVGNNIGVTSHHSMQEAMEGVLMFSSYKGPFVLAGGRDLRPLGAIEIAPGVTASRLESFWTRLYGPTDTKPVFERALSAVLPNDNLYLLFVPYEDPAIPSFATSSSVVFAYDYGRDQWHKWTGLNMAGGMTVLDDQLIWSSRSYDGAGGPTYGDITNRLYQQQKRKAQYNYADHDQAISFRHRAHWETLTKPGFFKRFLRCKIFSHETRDATSTAFTLQQCYDFDESKTSSADTLTFTTTTQKSLTPKLRAETCRAMQLVFASSAYYQPLTISGYELEAVASFRPEYKE